MANFYDAVMKFFDESKIALARKFLPPYIAGIANHILNIENQKREFYFEHGQVSNMRLHVFFCAPPGFMKTLILSKLLEGPYSVMGGSETILSGFEGSMTEAGFVGSIKLVNDEPMITYGAAHEHREAILGIDEFAALTNIMKMEHSMNLDNAMLTALDKGYVRKRLAAGKIDYSTQLSLFTGSQPARFDLTSGLGRRFWFEFFVPTKAEEHKIKLMRRGGKNVTVPHAALKECRKRVDDIFFEINQIERITYDASFYAMLDRLKVPHYEEILYEKFALGYYVTRLGVDSKINISATTDLQKLVQQGHEFRRMLKGGAELSQVVMVIKELENPPRRELVIKLMDYGIEPDKAAKLLAVLQKQDRIEILSEKSGKKGRPIYHVVLKEDY